MAPADLGGLDPGPVESMEPNIQESNKYAKLSRWRIGEADNYLRVGNNIQASERGGARRRRRSKPSRKNGAETTEGIT